MISEDLQLEYVGDASRWRLDLKILPNNAAALLAVRPANTAPRLLSETAEIIEDNEPLALFRQNIDCNFTKNSNLVEKIDEIVVYDDPNKSGADRRVGEITTYRTKDETNTTFAVKRVNSDYSMFVTEVEYWRKLTLADASKDYIVPLIAVLECDSRANQPFYSPSFFTRKNREILSLMPVYGPMNLQVYLIEDVEKMFTMFVLGYQNYVDVIFTHMQLALDWLHSVGYTHGNPNGLNWLMDYHDNFYSGATPRLFDFTTVRKFDPADNTDLYVFEDLASWADSQEKSRLSDAIRKSFAASKYAIEIDNMKSLRYGITLANRNAVMTPKQFLSALDNK
jgi:hypothetical protein